MANLYNSFANMNLNQLLLLKFREASVETATVLLFASGGVMITNNMFECQNSAWSF